MPEPPEPPERARDVWAEWTLRRQWAGAPPRDPVLPPKHPRRDRVLEHAALREGDVVLDVGTGAGVLGFRALALVGPRGRVLFSDVSQDLLDACRALAVELGVLDRCAFVRTPAEARAGIADASVDVVTTRSVLIYVADKARAFRACHRVLKPGGRLSIYEPINRFRNPQPPGSFWGYDVTPVWDVAAKVRAVYERLQPPATDPILSFDERDLLAWAEAAGFPEVHLEYRVTIRPPRAGGGWPWERFCRIAPNPRVPTLEEAMHQALTPAEAERFTAYLRPLVEQGSSVTRFAEAYLWAVKHP